MSFEWNVAYNFILYSSLLDLFKNAWMSMPGGLLIVSNTSRAWYVVILEYFG